MRIEYSKRAVADLQQVAALYRRSGNRAAAERIAVRVRDLVARLAEFP